MGFALEALLDGDEVARGTVVIASGNAHKIAEIRQILQPLFPGFSFLAAREVGDFPEPVEDGETFVENALIKARAIHEASGLPCVADDSGLVVDALGGAPGVLSARYSGVHGDDAANNAKLLAALDGVGEADRTARFACAVAFVGARACATGIGYCEGRVGFGPRGDNGFGYDPLFLPDDAPGRTMAELAPGEKNAISHRLHGLQALVGELGRLAAQG